MAEAEEQLVLVTGGTGFLGAWCIVQLLNAGYRVRTTVRSSKGEEKVREMLKVGEIPDPNTNKLTFAQVDLTKDDGWAEAVEGSTYVLHVASPFPMGAPKHEDDLIIPAREGTLRVLRAAKDASVKRVVLTSSFAAIGYGHPETEKPFTEETWTDLSSPAISAYQKSKTLAERAAWDFISKEGAAMELSVVNPTAILGPILGPNFATSIQLVSRMLSGGVPACPQIMFGVVDVRDVADLHLRAMTDPKAKGERFLAVAPPSMTPLEIAGVLREKLGSVAKKAPSRQLPNLILRLAGLLSADAAMLTPELGKQKHMTNEKAKRVLGWEPRSNVDAVVATAESLIKRGLVK